MSNNDDKLRYAERQTFRKELQNNQGHINLRKNCKLPVRGRFIVVLSGGLQRDLTC